MDDHKLNKIIGIIRDLNEEGVVPTNNVSGGKIAAFSFNDKRLSSFTTSTQDKFGISLDADYQLITIHGDSGDGKNNIGDNDRDNVMIAIGQLTDDQFGIKGFTTGGDRAFELSSIARVASVS